MAQETPSIEPTGLPAPEEAAPGAGPLALSWLVVSLALIAVAALAFCGLLAAVWLLGLYARAGVDGVSDFYEDFRLDYRLKTQIGAGLVGALYVGVAGATLTAARLRGAREWPKLLALDPPRGERGRPIALFALTIAYGVAATLAMTLPQDHRIVISGPTDVPLVITIAANLVILAPIAEELLFRGWLYTGLRNRLSFWPSFLLTASLFAAIHWDANHRRVLLVFPLAIALGLLREITNSIRPTIALHTCYNLVIVSITVLAT